MNYGHALLIIGIFVEEAQLKSNKEFFKMLRANGIPDPLKKINLAK